MKIPAAAIAVSIMITLCPAQDAHQDAMAGGEMDAAQAEKMEAILAENPDDISTRTKLLGYYFLHRRGAEGAIEKRRGHVLWVIANHPSSELAALPYCGMNAHLDPEGYVEAKKLWTRQTEAHPDDPDVLGNAGGFFQLQDRKLADDFLQRALKADPGNPDRADKLGQFYALSRDAADAPLALTHLEDAQEADKDEMSRFYRLSQLAKAAHKAGDLDKAGRYAKEVIAKAALHSKDWNYGNAIHHGNNILGLCALAKGDIALAETHLILAGKTPGSPQLDSFGPNMLLAKDLLVKDRKEVVLEYLGLCRAFWEMGGDRLDKWTRDANAGEIPDFGGNLNY